MSDAKSGRATTRERILAAACRLVREEGVGRLTLDAVSRASGVSKGGLLYHFPSKEDLIAGMVQYLADRFDAELEREWERESGGVPDHAGSSETKRPGRPGAGSAEKTSSPVTTSPETRNAGSRRSVTRGADDRGRFVRSYIRGTFSDAERLGEISAALLAAVVVRPKLLDPLRERQREWQRRIEDDGLDPALATALRLAADGLWFADLFDLAPPQGELRARVLALLQQWAEGGRP